jgi:hypothetical protein
VERPKIVEKSILQEKPVIQYVDKKVQLVREVLHRYSKFTNAICRSCITRFVRWQVAVERPVERQFVRKVIVERIIEKVGHTAPSCSLRTADICSPQAEQLHFPVTTRRSSR